MADKQENNALTIGKISCDEFRTGYSVGIPLGTVPIFITYKTICKPEAESNWHTPCAVVYSSDDGEVAAVGEEEKNHYVQYSVNRSDAFGVNEHAKDYFYENYNTDEWESWESWLELNRKETTALIVVVRYEEYVQVRMENHGIIMKATTKLPSNMKEKEVYLTVSGEFCEMYDFDIVYDVEPIVEGTIAAITYRKAVKHERVGDIPNFSCVGWWTAHSDGIMVGEEPVLVTYDTVSYMEAYEVWHTPVVAVYSSLDQNIDGIAYTEYTITRSDGYAWKIDAEDFNSSVKFAEDWEDWQVWLDANKKGVKNCRVTAVRKDNTVFITQTNCGITVKTIVQIPISNTLPIFIALSGELCSVSNIRIE